MPHRNLLIWSGAILIRLAILLVSTAFLMGANLPKDVPIPEARPETTPVPEQTDKVEKSQPQPTEPNGDKAKPAEEQKTVEDDYVPPPIEKEDPAKLAVCLSELKALGVAFKESPAIDENNGCGIDRPITVTSLGHNVSLKPGGEMRCQTALGLARWTANVVIPSLKQAKPDETLSALNQASTYVCRKRNNATTGKISEHAHGNAVDIAGLTFKSGAIFTIKPRMKDSTMDGALQRAIATAACLYFTTVLDPGSDAAHETHLHLDIIERKNSYRLCW